MVGPLPRSVRLSCEGMSKMNCPFCSPQVSEIVLETDHCVFTQVPQTVLIGSGLIIPRSHRETVFDLTKEEWHDTHKLLHQVKVLLDEQYNPDGYNIGWNSGAVAGQEIFHAHLHVVPRFKDEPFAGRGIRWWLKREENRRN